MDSFRRSDLVLDQSFPLAVCNLYLLNLYLTALSRQEREDLVLDLYSKRNKNFLQIAKEKHIYM